jgi:hypothetical protein
MDWIGKFQLFFFIPVLLDTFKKYAGDQFAKSSLVFPAADYTFADVE